MKSRIITDMKASQNITSGEILLEEFMKPLGLSQYALAKELADNEEQIVAELNGVQDQAMDIGGYYLPDANLATTAMRPSDTFNAIIDGIFATA